MVKNYWEDPRELIIIRPCFSIFALHEALNLVLEEGLENRWARHKKIHEALKVKLEDLGGRCLVEEK
jgi:alanine-glyoxylate transaminase/serine-glyoxylate transaminase/serine-pyruvate transaminase